MLASVMPESCYKVSSRHRGSSQSSLGCLILLESVSPLWSCSTGEAASVAFFLRLVAFCLRELGEHTQPLGASVLRVDQRAAAGGADVLSLDTSYFLAATGGRSPHLD